MIQPVSHMRSSFFPLVLTLSASLSLCPALATAADPLDRTLALEQQANRDSAKVQKRIDELDDASREALEEYRRLQQRIELLGADNRQLSARVAAQEQRMGSLQRQLEEIDDTRREIPGLLMRMGRTLDTFVAADLPFLPAERQRRLSGLRDALARPELADGEKFRRLLEAYQVELEYGRTIEAYQDTIETPEGGRTVDLFRLGRTGLYYAALDRTSGAVWDPQANAWSPLAPRHLGQVAKALRIARKRAAPGLLVLPLQAPEQAQ